MDLKKLLCLTAALALTAVSGWSQTVSPTVLTQGHNPVEVVYENSEWSFFIDGTETENPRFAPEEAIFHLTDAAMLQIPANPDFSFLGEAGNPVWIVPHIESEGIILLGISGERISPGTFVNDQLNLHLVEVSGPGDFAMYGIGSPGEAILYQNSRDGIDESDVTPFAIESHDHQNWAFNASGHYELTFKASGTLAGGDVIESPEVIYRFAVGDVDPVPPPPVIVNEGDADVAIVMNNDQLVLEVFWGITEQAYANDEAVYRVYPKSRITVPEVAAYEELWGEAGSTVWVAPQAEEEGELFLAMAAENLPVGFFENEEVRVTLKTYEGPGDFAVYQTDSFGTPVVYLNTADGISDEDFRSLIVGEHYHMNWSFTEPGSYTVGLQASGTRVSDSLEMTSELTTFEFQVVELYPRQMGIDLTNTDTLTLSWIAEAQTSYQLQSREDIASGDWRNDGSPVSGNGNVISHDVQIQASQETLFYQIVEIEE